MHDPFTRYAPSEDGIDRSSPSINGTEFDRGHESELIDQFRPIYQSSPTATSADNASCWLWDDMLPSNNLPSGIPIPPYGPATAAWFNSPPPPPRTFHPVPSDSYSTHLGYSPSSGIGFLFSQRGLHAVTMPTVVERAQVGSGLIGAHLLPDELSCGFNDNYTGEYSRAISSSPVNMPMGQTFGAGMSNYTNPIFRPGPTLPLSSCHSTSTLRDLPPFSPAPDLAPTESLGTDLYLYPSPSFSGSSHPGTLYPETSNQVQPNMTASSGQRYTITVPLEAVEFPPSSIAGDTPFFRCCVEDCGIWISSEDRAIKAHMTRVHNAQKGPDDVFRCPWIGCGHSGHWGGMVRHVQTHLLLKWLCSVCKKSHTRPDSVRGHANKEAACSSAYPISYPSELAFTAKTNRDGTVTFTKILPPTEAIRT